jgi:microcystin-dependent protein
MEPFLGEIMLAGFKFAPTGWAFCDGQLLSIVQNQALYSLLGTTYGGDGATTFALPNLQGRVPLDTGGGYKPGDSGGETGHSLLISEIPAHTHLAQASSSDPNAPSPEGNLWAKADGAYQTNTSNTSMNPAAVGCIGMGEAHSNMQPYLVLNFMIAISGVFPTRG